MELKNYIEVLAGIVRTYPRKGGKDRKGMSLLRQGKDWTEKSADPERVAELL